MSAEAFLFKLKQMLKVVEYRKEHPWSPFAFTITPERLHQGCKYLDMQNRRVDSYWGGLFPFCKHPDNANHHALNRSTTISCIECKGFILGPNNFIEVKKKYRETSEKVERKRMRFIEAEL